MSVLIYPRNLKRTVNRDSYIPIIIFFCIKPSVNHVIWLLIIILKYPTSYISVLWTPLLNCMENAKKWIPKGRKQLLLEKRNKTLGGTWNNLALVSMVKPPFITFIIQSANSVVSKIIIIVANYKQLDIIFTKVSIWTFWYF